MRAVVVSVLMLISTPALADSAATLSQLDYLEVRAEVTVPYDRARDFGGWSAFGGDPICLDVRGQVLADESLSPIQTSLPAGVRCYVTKGRWIDPYTGSVIFNADAMDVDHVVPLKEAWNSGAWRWNRATRRTYANDLTDPNHLIAVTARANRSKGDRDPAEWLPPNNAFTCRYLEIWVGIKARWGLAVDPVELEALRQGLIACLATN